MRRRIGTFRGVSRAVLAAALCTSAAGAGADGISDPLRGATLAAAAGAPALAPAAGEPAVFLVRAAPPPLDVERVAVVEDMAEAMDGAEAADGTLAEREPARERFALAALFARGETSPAELSLLGALVGLLGLTRFPGLLSRFRAAARRSPS